MPESGAATAWRRVRCRPRLVVHAGSQAAATDPAGPTAAGFGPAARLRRSCDADPLATVMGLGGSAGCHDRLFLPNGLAGPSNKGGTVMTHTAGIEVSLETSCVWIVDAIGERAFAQRARELV